MTKPMPFQRATVEAALKTFRARKRVRRFLVADEVGLGKTIVAKELIRELMKWRTRPLVVFYICSNLSIAAQNRRKLLEVLPEEERESATSRVDRLTLVAERTRPTHGRLHLYTLTPDTSIPMRKNRRRDGRQEERALIHALVEEVFPVFFKKYKKTFFRRNARKWWASWYLKRARKNANDGQLQALFRASVRQEFGLAKGEHLLPALRRLDELQIIGHFRNALAASAIEELEPDLVIFDEFQRFRDLIEPLTDPAEQRVAGRLRGEDTKNPPALLLLSATPYRLYARRSEDATGASHHREFFELVEFLFGQSADAREKRARCEAAFARLEAELRKRDPASKVAREARAEIERLLLQVIARTERASHKDGWEGDGTEQLEAPVQSEDLLVFKHASLSFDEKHKSSVVPYWISIPLPMQTMGRSYVAWREAAALDGEDVPHLEETERDGYKKQDPWPHPRLRALKELLPPERLVAPWIAPSMPWWELGSPWKDEGSQPSKALLFSRFRAAPQAVAASLSYDLEAKYLSRERAPYPEITKRRLLSATEGRHALLALFHPSPFIVKATDPLASKGRVRADARDMVRRQIQEALQKVGIEVRDSAKRLPLWKLIAALEAKAGNWESVSFGWWEVNKKIRRGESQEGGLAELLGDWEQAAQQTLEAVRPEAVEMLADHAHSGPGVVLGRALYRHWLGAVDSEGFFETLGAAWIGLRNYFDQRWFFTAFKKGREKYPDVIRRLVVEGNLESVLDEHLWITSRLQSLEGPALANELRESLNVKTGLFHLHPLGENWEDRFSLRCHVAMPFVEARAAYSHEGEGETERIRTDDLRRAFNTPFWPHVLATTSVGQEGLDFHAWCDTIIHWDLCRNPVDLEQREGRIQRFGGLSIRRAVIDQLGADVFPLRQKGESPWAVVERLAQERLADESGLKPWWVCEGGEVTRHIFDVPTSEQRHWLGWLHDQRLLYRLALGQPNQEDLVEVLAEGDLGDAVSMREAAINLSPWFGDGDENATE